MSPIHAEHQAKQETQEYRDLAHERYKIEAKNAELKNRHGYGHATYTGLHGMTLQAAVSIFVVNVKRINTLLHAKKSGKTEQLTPGFYWNPSEKSGRIPISA